MSDERGYIATIAALECKVAEVEAERDAARATLNGIVAGGGWEGETARAYLDVSKRWTDAASERDRALALLREVRGNYPNGIRAALLARLDAMLFGKDGAK